MTDKEVQKLNRKELLEFLLDAQTENEELRKDRSELRKQVRQLEEELSGIREKLSQTNAALSRAKEDMVRVQDNSSDAGVQAAAILQEARVAADNVANTQREANTAREQRLQEWELRLQQKDELLIAAADSEASRCIQEANDSADLTRRHAEEAAERLRKTSEAQAADTVRKAEAAAALVLHNAEEAARATEEKAAADAELMLQRAQEDSNSFWQDVTELIQQKLFSNGGTGNGE